MTTRRNFLASSLLSSLGFSQTTKRPNILFVIADDWGFGHAGAYGAKWVNTPNFDRIAREGLLFNNCFTSNPKCSPCRATILTGRNTWQLKEAVNHQSIFPAEFPVYPSLLADAGYFTGHTGKGWGPGDFKSTGWANNPAGPQFNELKLKPPTSGISPVDYAGNFGSFLEKRKKDQPFCFWLGGHEPHRKYEEGSGIRAGKKPADVTLPGFYPDNRVIRSDYLDYAVEVEWFDEHLGRALKKLEEIGELDNTFVVVSSDHGEPFPRVKGQIYEKGFHIPLAIRWGKNIPQGKVVNEFINARDFAPTYLELAGVRSPSTFTGTSFLNLIMTGKSEGWRNVMLIGKERHDLGRPGDAGYPARAIRTPEFLYIRNYMPEAWPAGNPETGYRNVDDSPTKEFLLSGFDEYYNLSFGKRASEELYDMKNDRDCLKNLAANPEHAKVKRDLRDKMDEMLKAEGDPRALGRPDFFDTIEYTGPRKHAYDTWLQNQRPVK